MPTSGVQEVSEEQLKLADTTSVLQAMVQAAQERLHKIQGLVLEEEALLRRLKADGQSEEAAIRQKIRNIETAHQQKVAQESSASVQRARELDAVSMELETRRTESQVLLDKADGVRAQQHALLQERVDIERLKAQVVQQVEASAQISAEANARMADVAHRESKIAAMEQRVKTLETELQTREADVRVKELSQTEQLQHLEKLQADITPKVEEYRTLQSQVSEHRAKVDADQAALATQRQELEQYRINLTDFSDKLDVRDRNVKDLEASVSKRESDVKLRERALKKSQPPVVPDPSATV